jgi:transposase-like protein
MAMCERSNASVSQFCQSIGCSPTSYYQWKRKLAAKPQTSVFLRVLASEPTKDSIEIKLPEAGERREGTAGIRCEV